MIELFGSTGSLGITRKRGHCTCNENQGRQNDKILTFLHTRRLPKKVLVLLASLFA